MSDKQKNEKNQLELLLTHQFKLCLFIPVVNLVGKKINVNSFSSQRLITLCNKDSGEWDISTD